MELTENVPLSKMLKVATIDNYQGEQNDFVIFTAVRSNRRNGPLAEPNTKATLTARSDQRPYLQYDGPLPKLSNRAALTVRSD